MLVPSTIFEWGTAHVRVGFGRLSFPEVLTALESYLSA